MEHNFTIPNKATNSIIFKKDTGWDLYIIGDKLLVLGDCTRAQAETALDAHNPPDPQVAIALAATAKAALLARLGITADEAKLLLG